MTLHDLFVKLTSRKFFSMLIGVSASTMVINGFPDSEVTRVVGLIGAVGTIVTYICVEGKIDNNKNTT